MAWYDDLGGLLAGAGTIYGMSQLGKGPTPSAGQTTEQAFKAYRDYYPSRTQAQIDAGEGTPGYAEIVRSEQLQDLEHMQSPAMQELARRKAAQQFGLAQQYVPEYGQLASDEAYRTAMRDTGQQVDVLRGPGGKLIDEAYAAAQGVDPEFYRGRAQTGQRLGDLLQSFADPNTIRPTTYWGEGDERPQYSQEDISGTLAYNNAVDAVQQANAEYEEAQLAATIANTSPNLSEDKKAVAVANATAAGQRLRLANEAFTKAESAFDRSGARYAPQGAVAGGYAVDVGDVKDYGDPFGKFTGALSGSEEEMIRRGLGRQGAQTGALTGPRAMTDVVANAMLFGQGVQSKRDALGRALGQATSFLPASRSGFDPMQVALGRPSTTLPTTFSQPNMQTNTSGQSGNFMNNTFGAAGQSAGFKANQPTWLDRIGQGVNVAQDIGKLGW